MKTVIVADHISKEYRLGSINHGMLYKDLQSWAARRIGKADPHSKIGTKAEYIDKDRFLALDDVSFSILEGDRIGIIGKNGAGKSTLLKIISRITEPTLGEMKIRGRIASLLEVGTGFHPELTGRENIYLSGTIRGMKKVEVDKKLDEIIAFSEIEQFIDTPAKRYSSGMYVRLGFAVAAFLESEILIADEVLAVGDKDFQQKCLQKMDEVSSKQGRTVLFVSHQLQFISKLCNKGMLLDHGKVITTGEVESVLDRYLQNSIGSNGFIEYENNREKTICITYLSLVDSMGKISNRSKAGEQVYVAMSYNVNSDVKGSFLALHVMTPEGLMIIDSCDIDTNPDLLEHRKSGFYQTLIKLPVDILNAGNYYLEAWAGKPHQKITYQKTDMIMWEIEDMGSEISANNPTRKCIFKVPLKWDLRSDQ